MKNNIRLIICLIISLLSNLAISQNDFKMMINDSSFSLSLDKEYSTMINGKPVRFMVSSNDTLLFDDSLFSFKYFKEYKVAKTELDKGIYQLLMVTSAGNGFLIQKYSTIDPSALNEMMIDVLTKKGKSAGYSVRESDIDKKLKSGQKMKGIKAVVSNKKDKTTYEVLTYGKNDEGILVAIIIGNEDFIKTDQKIIDLLWDSLRIKEN